MAKKGLLLINLGSPDDPSTKSVARYLRQFLNDPYVIDIPAWLRFLLVNVVIAPTRSPKSAHAYQQIWTENGSPLVHTTRLFARKLWEVMGSEWNVRWAMRYGQPSIEQALKDFPPASDIFVVPLYPQYAQSSTQTAVDEVLKHKSPHHNIRVLRDFYDQPEFIEAQARKIEAAAQEFKPDHILLSYHGLPEHHLTKLHPTHCLKDECCHAVSDRNRNCYRAQAFATTRALTERLKIDRKNISLSFQSRLGRRPWIQPYTDIVVDELAAKGVKRLLVSCPSFVADCLETLEEVQIRLAEQFAEKGGELRMVPALNDDDYWVQAFQKMVLRNALSNN